MAGITRLTVFGHLGFLPSLKTGLRNFSDCSQQKKADTSAGFLK